MAVDRDKRSVATNKLGGFIAISFCVLSTCVLQLVASKPGQSLFICGSIIITFWLYPINFISVSDLDQPPTSVTTFLGETASFNCSIRKGDILWYVDDMFIVSVPSEYGASYMAGSSMANCITSTLHIRAIEQTNNSLIQCAVGVDGNLNRTYFPSTAHLLVQGISKCNRVDDNNYYYIITVIAGNFQGRSFTKSTCNVLLLSLISRFESHLQKASPRNLGMH